MVRSRVEPKTFFANERTFLQWLQISVLIMLTGLSLLGGTFSSLGPGSQCDSAQTAPTPSKETPVEQQSQFSCKASKVVPPPVFSTCLRTSSHSIGTNPPPPPARGGGGGGS